MTPLRSSLRTIKTTPTRSSFKVLKCLLGAAEVICLVQDRRFSDFGLTAFKFLTVSNKCCFDEGLLLLFGLWVTVDMGWHRCWETGRYQQIPWEDKTMTDSSLFLTKLDEFTLLGLAHGWEFSLKTNSWVKSQWQKTQTPLFFSDCYALTSHCNYFQ